MFRWFCFPAGSGPSISVRSSSSCRESNYFLWVLEVSRGHGRLGGLDSFGKRIILQRWFASTGDDPYHLYAASNAGSFVALVAYPFLVEPRSVSRTRNRSGVQSTAYLLFAYLAAPGSPGRTRTPSDAPKRASTNLDGAAKPKLDILAFVPSNLMFGVTTYVTTDIAPAPLFWIIPLAIYLLAFSFAFARRQLVPLGIVDETIAGAAILLTLIDIRSQGN